MHHQFMVSPKDKDLLRFLWWENGDLSSDPVDHHMRVHLFGATSSPGVPTYGLRKIASDHAERHAVEANQFVHSDFYIDDGVTSVGSVSSASCRRCIEMAQGYVKFQWSCRRRSQRRQSNFEWLKIAQDSWCYVECWDKHASFTSRIRQWFIDSTELAFESVQDLWSSGCDSSTSSPGQHVATWGV